MADETFKINHYEIVLDDEANLVSCTAPNFVESLKKELDQGFGEDDLYYIDNVNVQYFRFYKYDGVKVDVFPADKFSDKERDILVCACYPLEYKFPKEDK